MNFKISEIVDKKIWEDFSLKTVPNTFLQSWAWGEFTQSLGRKVWWLGIFKDAKLTGICLVIKSEGRLCNFLYVPRGPVADWKDLKVLDGLISYLKNLARAENCAFLRIEPSLPDTDENALIFAHRGFRKASSFTQVENAWLLNLNASEQELLANMRKTTRYLIRHGISDGIEIEISDTLKDAKRFVDLLKERASKKGFAESLHSDDYYLKQLEILAKEEIEKLFIAKKGRQVLAMAIIAFYGEAAYYLHSATNPATKESASYVLLWEAIREAKKRGCRYFNFWGVLSDENFKPGHPWYGFSLFKRGFGGYKHTYLRAQDYPINNRYYLYRYAEKARRLLRRARYGYCYD